MHCLLMEDIRRIYTTFILGAALLEFRTRTDSFGHDPLDLHENSQMLISKRNPLNKINVNKNGTLKAFTRQERPLRFGCLTSISLALAKLSRAALKETKTSLSPLIES